MRRPLLTLLLSLLVLSPARAQEAARIIGNEAATIGALRAFTAAQAIFRERDASGAFGSLAQLGEAKLIDEALASGEKQGYRFKVQVGDAEGANRESVWRAWASPVTPGKTGIRHFYVDESGVIRVSLDGPAGAESPALGTPGSEAPPLPPEVDMEESARNCAHNMEVLGRYARAYAEATGKFPFEGTERLGTLALGTLVRHFAEQGKDLRRELRPSAERLQYFGFLQELSINDEAPVFLFGHLDAHEHGGQCHMILTDGQVKALPASDRAAIEALVPEGVLKEAEAQLAKVEAELHRIRCSNNLKRLGLALLQHVDEHRFYPHSDKEENGPREVSELFAALVRRGGINDPAQLCCPASAKSPVPESANPRLETFAWPEAKDGESPSCFDCAHLSYTYRRRKLNGAAARGDQIIAADQRPWHVNEKGAKGYNVLFADAHIEFILASDAARVAKLKEALVFPEE